MAVADVEELFRRLCMNWNPGFTEQSNSLADALAEEVITRIAGASAEQLTLLRDMRAAVAVGEATLQMSELEALNARVAGAGRGPLYFNLVLVVYGEWSREMDAELNTSSTTGSDEEEGSDGDLRDMLWPVRRTGQVRVRGGHTPHMAVLLAALLARVSES